MAESTGEACWTNAEMRSVEDQQPMHQPMDAMRPAEHAATTVAGVTMVQVDIGSHQPDPELDALLSGMDDEFGPTTCDGTMRESEFFTMLGQLGAMDIPVDIHPSPRPSPPASPPRCPPPIERTVYLHDDQLIEELRGMREYVEAECTELLILVDTGVKMLDRFRRFKRHIDDVGERHKRRCILATPCISGRPEPGNTTPPSPIPERDTGSPRAPAPNTVALSPHSCMLLRPRLGSNPVE